MTVRVLVADDHALVSQGLQAMLAMAEGMELAGAASSADEIVDAVMSTEADVVLMDVNLGGDTSGIDATRRIKESRPEIKVLMLSMFTDPATVTEAIRAGADGYLSKSASREAVIDAVHDLVQGNRVLDPNVAKSVFGRSEVERDENHP